MTEAKSTKKLLALLLTAVLVLSTIPIGVFSAFAANAFSISIKDGDHLVENAQVTYSAQDADKSVLKETTETAKDGKLALPDLEAYLTEHANATVKLTYSVQAEDYENAKGTLDVTAADLENGVEIALTPYLTVTVHVTYMDGDGVSQVKEDIQLAADNHEIQGVADENAKTLTAKVARGSTVTVQPKDKTNQIFTIAAEDTDSKAEVKPDAGSTNMSTFTVQSDLTIKVTYSPITYTVKATIKNGKIAPASDDGAGGATIEVIKTNATQIFTLTPEDKHYKLTELKLGDVSVIDSVERNADGTYKYVLKTEQITGDNTLELTAVFSLKEYELSLSGTNVSSCFYKKSNEDEWTEYTGKAVKLEAKTKVWVKFESTNDEYAFTQLKNGENTVDVVEESDDISFETGDGKNSVQYRFELSDNTSITAQFDRVVVVTDKSLEDVVEVKNSVSKTIDGCTTYFTKQSKCTMSLLGDGLNLSSFGTRFYATNGTNDPLTHSIVFSLDEKNNEITVNRVYFKKKKLDSKTYCINGSVKIVYDYTAPKIDDLQVDGIQVDGKSELSDVYTNQSHTISFTVKDDQSGVKEVNGEKVVNITASSLVFDNETQKTVSEENGRYTFVAPAYKDYTGEIKYTVTATDKVDNETKDQPLVTIKNDTVAPVLKYVKFKQNDSDSAFKRFLNKISFGRLYGEKLTATLTATDEDSGFDGKNSKATLFFYKENDKAPVGEYHAKIEQNDEAKPGEAKHGEAVITIDKASDVDKKVFGEKGVFKGTIKYQLTDALGNSTGQKLLTSERSNILSKDENTPNSILMLEENAPTASIVLNTSKPENVPISYPQIDSNYDFTTEENKKQAVYFSSAPKLKISMQDSDSGLYGYTVTVNDDDNNAVSVDELVSDKGTELEEATYTLDLSTQDAKDNGAYEIAVSVTDNAGNVRNDAITVYKDEQAPQVDGFRFELKQGEYEIPPNGEEKYYPGVEDQNTQKTTASDITVLPYGFFFKSATKVYVQVSDPTSKGNAASGVKEVHCWTKDISDKSEVERKLSYDKANNAYYFDIEPNFKGQIYAQVTDQVENKSAKVHPDGSVLENREKHRTTSSITLTMPKAQGTQNNTYAYKYTGKGAQADAVLDYDTSQKVPLYNHDFKAGIRVEDTYSGIRAVRITVIEGNKKTVEEYGNDFELNGIGKFADANGKVNGQWEVTTEDNLITSVETKDFAVHGNYNDMVLLVELTDHAGNVSYDYYAFGIDKTAPTIDVTYDNNTGDTQSGAGAYFNAGRTATVTVTERNFNAENVLFKIANAEGKAPQAKLIKTVKGTANGDDTQHIFKVKFANDGVYTFDVRYTDRATNKASVDYHNSLAPKAFTVDKVLPSIYVSYDNNDAQNERYFKAYRTANITIVEHNFDVNRVVFKQTAALSGNSIQIPAVSWSHSGDTHVATIHYNTDGDYTFDVTMTDKAGNKETGVDYGSSVAAKDFTVDTSYNDMIKVSGVTDKGVLGLANGKVNENAKVQIQINDVNLQDYSIRLTRSRVFVSGESDAEDQVAKSHVLDNPKSKEQFANQEDVSAEFLGKKTSGSTNGSVSFGIAKRNSKGVKNDGLYTLTVQAKDKAGNDKTSKIEFSVNRFGSVFTFSDDLYKLVTENDGYTNHEINSKNLTVYEYNATKTTDAVVELIANNDAVSLKKGEQYTVKQDQKQSDTSWNKYAYTIDPSNFVNDGTYTIRVSSKDEANNHSQTVKYDVCSATFYKDSTAPEITSVNYSENVNSIVGEKDAGSAKTTELKVQFTVEDLIRLESVEVYLNGEKCQSAVYSNGIDDANTYTTVFAVSEAGSEKQAIRIVAKDKAGNELDTSNKKKFKPGFTFFDKITVTSNGFALFYANTLLFWLTIAGSVAIISCILIIIAIKRKKKTEDKAQD